MPAHLSTDASNSASDSNSFANAGVPAPLVDHLTAKGLTSPFPIQSATLPDSLRGRDVLGRGRTGSGKTLAFALPLVIRLATASADRRTRSGRPRGLVLVPTRELANQVHETVTGLGAVVGVGSTVIVGGVRQGRQVQALKSGVDIVIATPGRLEDLIQQGHCDLGDVRVTVLDEADHMADLGFLPAVTRILRRTPADGQRLLFSATLDRGVDTLTRKFLTDPVTHSVDPVEAPVSAMTHHVMKVRADQKAAVVHDLAAGRGRSVLFTRTKHGAKKLTKNLCAAGIPAVELHGNLGQSARERNLAAFSDGTVRVLVATDIAARGIHVDDIELVVHVDPPAEHKAYLHRSGRTARAGAEGTVVTVATHEQANEVQALTKKAGIAPQVVSVVPGAAEIEQVRGKRAPAVTTPLEPKQPQRPAGHNPRRQSAAAGVSGRPANRRSQGSGKRQGKAADRRPRRAAAN